VSNLREQPDGTVVFTGTSADDVFQYRVGTSGPFVDLGPATSFAPVGLVPGINSVQVRAVDVAGNPGPTASLILRRPTPAEAPGTPLPAESGSPVAKAPAARGTSALAALRERLAAIRASRVAAWRAARELRGVRPGP
jgi:hypothetical protein